MANVLVIDDDPQLTSLLRDVLDMEGHVAMIAGSGAEALTLSRRHLPDFILCDLNMPDMNGYEVFTAFRSNPNTRHVPFYFLTGDSDMELGDADGVINKPFHVYNLLDTINSCIPRSA